MRGLCGAHRVGKSALARAFSEKHGSEFLVTSASSVFKDMGCDPAVTYAFDTRLTIQEEILKRFDKAFARASPNAITDRTPLDMIAYTLGDVINGTLTPDQEVRLTRYVNDCIEVTNKRFSILLVVQPGIPLVAEEGKASLSPGYIEHLNSLIMGLSVDERIKTPHFYVPRHMTNMQERVSALEYAIGRVERKVIMERAELSSSALH